MAFENTLLRSVHPSLAGRSVFISGGGSGIGAAHVKAFAKQGARVGFVDIAEDESQALVESIAAEGHERPVFVRTDLTDVSAFQDALKTVAAANGSIDILVNNAANDQRHSLEEVTSEFFDDRIAVNLKHFVFAAQAVVPGMRTKGAGVIINTGSISWRGGFSNMPLYMTAKAGIEGLTRALARDLGPDRIRVNCIIPGWTMTERQLTLWVDDAARQTIKEKQCLPDAVYPQDIANMATWLGSDDSRMVTGQIMVVDGGWI
jgi:D-xylose 1-dehydrogenase